MVDMKVFLAVDEKRVKLATKAAFWKSATAMMWAVPTVEIWAVMREHGWSEKEIAAARRARQGVTPKRKAYQAGYREEHKEEMREYREDKKEELKAKRTTTEAKKRNNERQKQRYANDPHYRMKIKLRGFFNRIVKKVKERKLSIDLEQTKRNMKPNGEYDIDAYENALEKTLPDGVTMDDWRSGKVNLLVDHILSLDFAIEHDDKFPGLLNHANSPANVMFLDMTTNSSKGDKIILEIIPPYVPGYPFTGLNGVYQTFEEARVRREPFMILNIK